MQWREAGDDETDRGKTSSLNGVVEIEFERFLRRRRAAYAESEALREGTLAGHVFISYVSEDSDLVDRLEDDLKQRHIRVWRDRSSLKPGDQWEDAPREAIRTGTFFISCFSPASAKRSKSYMNAELAASSRRRPHVPMSPG